MMHPEKIIREAVDPYNPQKTRSKLLGDDSSSARNSIKRGSTLRPSHLAGNMGKHLRTASGDIEAKAYTEGYQKVVNMKLERQEAKLREYAQFMKDRICLLQSKQANPLVETFDLLHMQEVSLHTKLLSIP